jgi:ABC-2 type transport system permease protein
MSPMGWRSGWRLFWIGGTISFRALFVFLNPWVYIPVMLIAPIVQMLLFAYIGRAAGVENAKFYVLGNAMQYAALPCLWGMGQGVWSERFTGTLGLVLSSPASRMLIFLGRALPVVVNGWFVSMFALLVGGLVLDVHFDPLTLFQIALVMLVGSFACTGLGLILGATSLRFLKAALLGNVLFDILLVFSGANVARSALPAWMDAVSGVLPFTHAISASRGVSAGQPWSAVRGDVVTELLVGAVYLAVGLCLVARLERSSRRRATLELT